MYCVYRNRQKWIIGGVGGGEDPPSSSLYGISNASILRGLTCFFRILFLELSPFSLFCLKAEAF